MEPFIFKPKLIKYYKHLVVTYPNHIKICSQISPAARNLLDIILIIMEGDNSINLDKNNIVTIIGMAHLNQGINLNVQSLRDLINELSKNELMFKYTESKYYVSPIYFIKFWDDELRRRIILELLEKGLLSEHHQI